jgi:hypothetical protein
MVLGDEKLSRGSGLFVGEQGTVANHHFLQSPDTEKWSFRPGDYRLQVYAQVVGEKSPTMLFGTTLSISADQSKELEKPDTGIYFDCGPKSRSYFSHIDKRASKAAMSDIEPFLKAMLTGAKAGKKKA